MSRMRRLTMAERPVARIHGNSGAVRSASDVAATAAATGNTAATANRAIPAPRPRRACARARGGTGDAGGGPGPPPGPGGRGPPARVHLLHAHHDPLVEAAALVPPLARDEQRRARGPVDVLQGFEPPAAVGVATEQPPLGKRGGETQVIAGERPEPWDAPAGALREPQRIEER